MEIHVRLLMKKTYPEIAPSSFGEEASAIPLSLVLVVGPDAAVSHARLRERCGFANCSICGEKKAEGSPPKWTESIHQTMSKGTREGLASTCLGQLLLQMQFVQKLKPRIRE